MTKQRPRSLFLAGLVLLASGWFSGASCGGPGASAPTSPGPAATPTPLSTAVARYLYLLRQQGVRPSQLQIFKVDGNTGDLAEVPGSPVTGVTAFYRLPIHPTGRFLYGLDPNLTFEGWSIDPATGLLRSMPGVPFTKNPGSVTLTMFPGGQFAYFPGSSRFGIDGFSLDIAAGVPTLIPGSPFGPTITGGITRPEYTTFACVPARQRLYCVAQRTSALTADLMALSLAHDSATGALTDLRVESPISGVAGQGFWLIQGVGDQFVYAAFGTRIFGYRIATSGALTMIPGFPIESGPLQSELLVQLVAHPSGRFLYAVAGNFIITGPDVGHVDGFEIDLQTGALRTIPGSPFLANSFVSTGQDDHIQMVFEPNGRFALFAVGGAILRAVVESSGALRSGGAAIRQPMTNTDIALASW